VVSRRVVILTALAAAACPVAGCGGSAPSRHRAGAEPAVAPAPSAPAAGHQVRVGDRAEGIAVDPDTGLVAVAVRAPSRIVLLSARSGRIIRRVPLTGPARHLQLAPRSRLLVPEAPVDRLLEPPLRRGDGRRRTIAVGSLPHDAAAADGRVFVADEFGRAVSVLAGGRQVRRIGGFIQPGGCAAHVRHAPRLRLVSRVAVAGTPYGVAIDPRATVCG
jgi:DNA-binding beta-propeller fold protein YncE